MVEKKSKKKKGLDFASFMGVEPASDTVEDKKIVIEKTSDKENENKESKSKKKVSNTTKTNKLKTKIDGTLLPSEFKKIVRTLSEQEQMEVTRNMMGKNKVNSLIRINEPVDEAFAVVKSEYTGGFKSGVVSRALEVYFSVLNLANENNIEGDLIENIKNAIEETKRNS